MIQYAMFFLCLIMPTLVNADHPASRSPIGIWKTIDDVSGKPKALVQLYETPDNHIAGKILKVFPRPGVDNPTVCQACKGAQHNQPLMGLTFLERLKKSNKSPIEWSDGRILDPKNGKNYHCMLQLAENGQKLHVRGYLGVPMFGRTQTWVRETTA